MNEDNEVVDGAQEAAPAVSEGAETQTADTSEASNEGDAVASE